MLIDEQRCYSYIRYKNCLFYRKGIKWGDSNKIDEKTMVTICGVCLRDLKKNVIPRYSAGNKMWIGDIPKELTNLTIPELRLIGKYRHNSCVIKLKSGSCDGVGVQSALKGNVITFPQHLSNVLRKLPLTLSDLCDEIKIVFVGTEVLLHVDREII